MRVALILAPWLVLLTGIALVGENYSTLPAMWPSHFDIHNVPNGWSHKSWEAVLLPFGLGFGICAFFEGLAQFARVANNSLLGPRWSQQATSLNQEILRVTSLALATLLSYLGCTLPLGHGAQPWVVGVVVVAVTLYAVVRVMRFMARVQSSGDLPPGYRGVFYYNPEDSRHWVPKLSGLGYTLNFAHKGSWVWMGVLLIGPLLAILAVVHF